MYQQLTQLEELDAAIAAAPMALLVFTTNDCGVCHVVKDKIGQVMATRAPELELFHISIPDLPEASGRFMVFSAPVVLAYLEGQEVLREAGIISIPDLEERLERSLNLSS